MLIVHNSKDIKHTKSGSLNCSSKLYKRYKKYRKRVVRYQTMCIIIIILFYQNFFLISSFQGRLHIALLLLVFFSHFDFEAFSVCFKKLRINEGKSFF